MDSMPRRRFLDLSSKTIVSLGVGTLAARRPVRATPASDKVRLAAIGVGGRCSTLIRGLLQNRGVEFPLFCDVYPKRDTVLGMQRAVAEAQGEAPGIEPDFRRVLDDKTIDGVVIGTPDHWHAPLAIFACQAEKDVYVEKPPSHNVWEGRKMAEAAARYKRVVQVGTQNRSAPYVRKALELIRGGAAGDIPLCKVYNMKGGGPFRLGENGKPPEGMDYNTWLGPAQERPYNARICYGGGWHQFWDFSGGDMADDGVHQLDIARWLFGVELPTAVHGSGGRIVHRGDDGEVPDTQVVTYEFGDRVMTFELTQYAPYMRKTNGQTRFGDAFPYWLQNSTRIEFYGTKKFMILGRHGGGWQLFTADGKVDDQMFGRFPDPPHQKNFIDCIKSRETPNAPALEGHRSAALVHLGNIATRLRRRIEFDPKEEKVVGDAEAQQMLKRKYRKGFEVPELI